MNEEMKKLDIIEKLVEKTIKKEIERIQKEINEITEAVEERDIERLYYYKHNKYSYKVEFFDETVLELDKEKIINEYEYSLDTYTRYYLQIYNKTFMKFVVFFEEKKSFKELKEIDDLKTKVIRERQEKLVEDFKRFIVENKITSWQEIEWYYYNKFRDEENC